LEKIFLWEKGKKPPDVAQEDCHRHSNGDTEEIVESTTNSNISKVAVPQDRVQ
jgi:hypothetical protein